MKSFRGGAFPQGVLRRKTILGLEEAGHAWVAMGNMFSNNNYRSLWSICQNTLSALLGAVSEGRELGGGALVLPCLTCKCWLDNCGSAPLGITASIQRQCGMPPLAITPCIQLGFLYGGLSYAKA